MSFQKGQDSPVNLQNGVGAESSSVKARLAYNRGSTVPELGRVNGVQRVDGGALSFSCQTKS